VFDNKISMNEEYNSENNQENETEGEHVTVQGVPGTSHNAVMMVVVAVIVVVLALMYIWGSQVEEEHYMETGTSDEIPMPQKGQTEPLSTSDEIVDIEKDLNTTDIEGIDVELEQMEAELDTMLN